VLHQQKQPKPVRPKTFHFETPENLKRKFDLDLFTADLDLDAYEDSLRIITFVGVKDVESSSSVDDEYWDRRVSAVSKFHSSVALLVE